MKQLYKYFLIIGILSMISVIATATTFKFGIENVSPHFVKQFAHKKIGLITNQTGVDKKGVKSVVVLQRRGLTVSYLFAPEHGYDGTVGAAARVANSIDKETGIPIVSLYGHGSGKMIPEKVINDIDVVMFDIGDAGMRHYTYISTLLHAMRVAATYNKQFVVFDRPNPLGVVMEGPLVEDGLRSFISVAAVPVRHGMTMGELAWYFNKYELKSPIDLQVVKMHHYNRLEWPLSGLGAPLSPGLRTLQACYGYSFLGILGEIIPIGTGLGTEARYQCITLPKRMGVKSEMWGRLQKKLKIFGIDSVLFDYKNPRTGNEFSGLRLTIKNINKVDAFALLYMVVSFFVQEGISLKFSREFDIAIGTKIFRELFQGKQSYKTLVDSINQGLTQFFSKARSSFMYTPFPVVRLMK